MSIKLDTAYGRSWIRHIGNWSYAFSCEELALIRRISFYGYGVLHKPELRPTKDFEVKYNKVKAKLALMSSSTSASKAFMVKNKGLIAEAYEWDEEEVSLDDNEMVEVKVLMALAEENDAVSKEGARNDYLCIDLNYVEEQRSNLLSKHINLVHELNICKGQLLVLKQAKLDFLTMQHVNTEILKENKNLRTELKELKAITETWLNSSNKVNQCIGEQIPSQKKRIIGVDQLTEDRSNESSVCSTPLPLLKKLDGAEPISRPKTIKLIMSFKSHSASAGKLKSVKIEDDPPLAIVMKELNNLKLQFSKNQSSYSKSNQPHQKKRSIQEILNTFKRCEVCGSLNHTTIDHYDIKWFKRGETLQAKKAEALKSTRAESSNVNRSKTPTKSGCSRHMTGVKSYLHKYVEQSGPKVVFGDDFTCTTEGYGSIKCNGIVFTKVSFVNGLKYNLISITQLYDAKCPVYIYNLKDHLGKFDIKADDGYLLGYSLVSKAFRVFNTRRQQTVETYHITFDESPDAIKFSKPLVDNINIAETEMINLFKMMKS
ncbi:hypothetical protein Tco_0257273 [Tanacetum coccineum]